MFDQGKCPLIFDIRNFSIDDGPGIRTSVFLKGCSLSCIWCHNPESMDSKPEIAFYSNLCINCETCFKICSEDAIRLDNANKINRSKCNLCGDCVKECPANALRILGKYYSVDDLLKMFKSNLLFYETSGGGVTFSGGEPTFHMDYLSQLIKGLKNMGIHVAIQTAGFFDIHEFKKKLLPYVDLIFFDIKFIDSSKHKKYTGKDNREILNNFIYLVKKSTVKIIPRVPFVQGITTNYKNLEQIAIFLKKLGCSECSLLSYNPGGIPKRLAIGKSVPPNLPNNVNKLGEEENLKSFFRNVFY